MFCWKICVQVRQNLGCLAWLQISISVLKPFLEVLVEGNINSIDVECVLKACQFVHVNV